MRRERVRGTKSSTLMFPSWKKKNDTEGGSKSRKLFKSWVKVLDRDSFIIKKQYLVYYKLFYSRMLLFFFFRTVFGT